MAVVDGAQRGDRIDHKQRRVPDCVNGVAHQPEGGDCGAEARDEQWIGFDNQFFRNPSNAGLRAAMATHFEKWKIGASCGSKIGGPDGLGGSQLSFGLKGSGAHLHMHNTAFNYLFFGEKKWTFNLG